MKKIRAVLDLYLCISSVKCIIMLSPTISQSEGKVQAKCNLKRKQYRYTFLLRK